MYLESDHILYIAVIIVIILAVYYLTNTKVEPIEEDDYEIDIKKYNDEVTRKDLIPDFLAPWNRTNEKMR